MIVAKFHDKKLLEALKANQIFLVKSSLAAGANPNIHDINWEPILHVAARMGRLEIMQALIAAGAEVEELDREHVSALRKCSRLGLLAPSRLLIEAGSSLFETDATGDTLLHNCCARGRKGASFREIAELLIQKGAKVDARNERGETPMHHAARYGGAMMVRSMILARADLNARDLDGHTPLHAAALGIDNEDGMRELLGARPDVNSRDRIGQTSLHMIANKSKIRPPDVAVAKALIAAGADKWLPDIDDFTPFDRADAARMQGKEILPELLAVIKPTGIRPPPPPPFDPKTGKPFANGGGSGSGGKK